jgi:hypothetical protein
MAERPVAPPRERRASGAPDVDLRLRETRDSAATTSGIDGSSLPWTHQFFRKKTHQLFWNPQARGLLHHHRHVGAFPDSVQQRLMG